jgi:hypothetical protein
VPDAGQVGAESAPATLGTGLETSDPEKPEEPEEWLAGGVGGDPAQADEERRPE